MEKWYEKDFHCFVFVVLFFFSPPKVVSIILSSPCGGSLISVYTLTFCISLFLLDLVNNLTFHNHK
jgi:hypothetical protein